MSEIVNARIMSTQLGREDHGIPTCWVMCDLGGAVQGFGGYDLRAWGEQFVMRTLEATGVELWEDLPGKIVRLKTQDGLLVAIGHPIEDRWFEPKVEAKS